MKDTHCDITVYPLFCIPIYFTWANNSVSSLSFSLISLTFFYSVHLILLSFWILSCVISIPPWPNTQNHLCSVAEVLDGNRGRVYGTVGVLLSMAPPLISPSPQVQLAGFALFYLSIMSVLCAIYVHLALRIWTHTLHETPDRQHKVIRQIHSNRELKILCCSLKKHSTAKFLRTQNIKSEFSIFCLELLAQKIINFLPLIRVCVVMAVMVMWSLTMEFLGDLGTYLTPVMGLSSSYSWYPTIKEIHFDHPRYCHCLVVSLFRTCCHHRYPVFVWINFSGKHCCVIIRTDCLVLIN